MPLRQFPFQEDRQSPIFHRQHLSKKQKLHPIKVNQQKYIIQESVTTCQRLLIRHSTKL